MEITRISHQEIWLWARLYYAKASYSRRRSNFAAKTDIREIVSGLGVNQIIMGSVYGADDSLRIQLQLIGIYPE